MVITPENATRLSPVFKGKRGKLLLKLGLKLTGIDHVNDIHQWVEDQGIAPGPAFATALLDPVNCMENPPFEAGRGPFFLGSPIKFYHGPALFSSGKGPLRAIPLRRARSLFF